MIPMVRKNQQNPFFSGLFNDDFINRFLEGPDVKKTVPSVNVTEAKEKFIIELAAPGYVKDDIRVKIEDDVLSVSSEKKIEEENGDNACLRREFSFSSFKRSFTLPENIERAKIEASMENGILKIVLPKKEEAKESEKEIVIR